MGAPGSAPQSSRATGATELMPQVSILLPVHNGERYLAVAIRSLLCQTFPDFELLVLDDDSSDGSRAIAESFGDPRIRIEINPQRLGLARTLDRGLEIAKAPLIARQDADDISRPDRLERQVGYLAHHPSIELLGAQATVIGEGGEVLRTLSHPLGHNGIRWGQLFDNSFVHSSVMFSRDAILKRFGGYDGRFRFAEDFELWSRVVAGTRVANVPQRLVEYRIHTGAMSHVQRSEIASVNERLLARNLRLFLGDAVWRSADGALLARFQQGLSRADVPGMLGLLARMTRRYLRRYPESRVDREFWGTLGWLLARLAGRVARG